MKTNDDEFRPWPGDGFTEWPSPEPRPSHGGDGEQPQPVVGVDEQRVTRPMTCSCGAKLAPRRGMGRRPCHCSPACRRRADRLRKQLRRRQRWLVAWHELEGNDAFTPAEIAAGIEDVQLDIRELTAALHRAPEKPT